MATRAPKISTCSRWERSGEKYFPASNLAEHVKGDTQPPSSVKGG